MIKKVATPDFIAYGFEPEFIGRLPVRVACENLDADDLEMILLQSEGSILRQYAHDFRGYGIDMSIEPDAIRQIAERAAGEKTGARGLMTVLETILREYKFELPSTTIKELKIDSSALDDPKQLIEKLQKDTLDEQRKLMLNEVKQFAERFADASKLELEITDDAAKAIVDESLKTRKTVRAICDERFRDYEFGLKLINRNTGQKKFVINRETFEKSVDEISRWVRESYAQARGQ
jgi:ATP-dependent protease Clp ATPase subunit